MSEATIKPVIEKLESLFTTFNKRFYNGELEKPVITVSPDEGRNAYGWCTTYKAWKNPQDKEKGYYEINICAEHLSRNFNELCSTLLHEMVHLWNLQTEIQDTSRGGSYHNKKFKEVAEQHGLHIEQVPKYGWTKTSLNEEGEQLIEQVKDKNFDIYRDSAAKMKGKRESKQSSRKYVCPCCGLIIRATKEIHVQCMDCGMEFEEAE